MQVWMASTNALASLKLSLWSSPTNLECCMPWKVKNDIVVEQTHDQDNNRYTTSLSCCGLAIETDAGENRKGRAYFTVKALSGSTRRRIELACDTASERSEWVLALQQFQPVQLLASNVLFARVLIEVRHHDGTPAALPCPPTPRPQCNK